jgi:Flp pilus assembly protein TadG
MRRRIFNKSERGTTMAEFAIVSGVFFMLIIGIIEFGRLLYTHNALTDAARRGARYAVTHGDTTSDPDPNIAACVKNVVVYGEFGVNPTTCVPTGQPLINGLTTANVNVVYQGADLDNDPSTPPTSYGMNLGTVTVTIGRPATPYQFNLSIPFFHAQFDMPAYTTTMTAESAGTIPDDL